jgi:AcrR family transcriptional regulator
VAAVNYHFGDKERLYMAVIQYAVDPAVARLPHLNLNPQDPPEERLRKFIHGFLSNILEEGRPACHGKLMAHETIEPTPALDLVVEKLLRPINVALHAIVGELLGPEADPDLVSLCTASIISQCTLYHYSKEIIVRLEPHETFGPGAVERLADHITRFSLAGIRALALTEKARDTGHPGGVRDERMSHREPLAGD